MVLEITCHHGFLRTNIHGIETSLSRGERLPVHIPTAVSVECLMLQTSSFYWLKAKVCGLDVAAGGGVVLFVTRARTMRKRDLCVCEGKTKQSQTCQKYRLDNSGRKVSKSSRHENTPNSGSSGWMLSEVPDEFQ